MPQYCILEIDDGLTIAEHPQGVTAEDTARQQGGIVIDSGPFESYEDACDALEALQGELDERDDTQSDVPGTQALEGRYETGD